MNGRKRPVAEFGEGRPQINKTVANTSVAGLSDGVLLRPRLAAVSEVARTDRAVVTINLVMHLTPELLRRSFYVLARNTVPRTNGVWDHVHQGLEEHFPTLNQRVHQGSGTTPFAIVVRRTLL